MVSWKVRKELIVVVDFAGAVAVIAIAITIGAAVAGRRVGIVIPGDGDIPGQVTDE
ncbi:MAG: hypothetical protein ACOYUK_05235 [Patescibacteria group bacterium]